MSNVIWNNGEFLNISEVTISPLDRGFQFGDGLFETIRFQKGNILFLDDHINRLTDSLWALGYDTESPHIASVLNVSKLRSIVLKLADSNGLISKVCRIKVLISRGVQPDLGLPEPRFPTVIVMIFPYKEPSLEEYNYGWRTIVLEEAFTPSMSIHKSASYLFYLWAKQQAIDSDAQEAIIPDKDGMIAEGSVTSLLLYKDGVWYHPESKWKLPGITAKNTAIILERLGYKVKYKKVPKNGVKEFDTLWLLNSMLGIMPVRCVNNFTFPRKMNHLAEKVRNILFKANGSLLDL